MALPSTFLDACRRRPVTHTPVWYMRQAGRYQPEYRKIRESYSLVDICKTPELCMQVTKLPVDQLGVDAAILFSDIMIPVGAMGVEFDIQEHVGPVIASPIRTEADVARLHTFVPEESLPYVLETIRLLKANLSVPLIGFAGAPFTLASYLVEGRPSRDYVKTKQLMWSRPDLWFQLMDKLADSTIPYLRAQVAAGAAALQIFDSWVGSLAPEDFRTFVLPTMRRIFSALADLDVPLIYFGKDTAELLADFTETGATVIGVDWKIPLSEACRRVGREFAVQGNLDPVLLFAPWSAIEPRVRAIIDAGLRHSGFVFNLGHGVTHHNPPVDPAILQRLTAFVHEYSMERMGMEVAQHD
ncbi:uroporphyrinogen decarboxylase [Alicyclobacillus contaminans]|uniref:uroporphyrinogen decarboxylase n=1 Tax=Alicyclobacillus contaminans TaxID=392016 RepID=UPI00047C1686|nr:uroporphyrinogen decarboxylase [Alicyclobacillus contaminans]GMA51957.1 uroporphyrinogen decarboxylase [Alicyclobacillus contaminans]